MKEVIFVIVLITIAWLIVMLLMVAGHVIASLVCRWLEKGDD